MLRFFFNDADRRGRLGRREWLRIGGLAAFGGQVRQPSVFAVQPDSAAAHPPGFGRAKSVIIVYTSGGQSQLDTWDPKPDAPDGIRGEFRAISTAAAGVQVCEHMPRLAAMADRYTIIRSMSHNDLDHGSATYLTLTGCFHPKKSSNPPPKPTDQPSLGAVLKRVRPGGPFPYEAVYVNGPAQVPELIAPGQDGGFLGRSFAPLVLGDVSSQPVAIGCLDPLPGLEPSRLQSRASLRQELDRASAALERDPTLADMNGLYRQAFELLSRPQTRRAFELSAEEPALRDRYGRHRSGQACLLARRLVEAGVPLVTVIWNHTNRGQDKDPADTDLYGWDTHNDIFYALKEQLLPRFDVGFSTLLADLDQRGLLDTTLVLCMGEFGRAPRIALESGFAGRTPGRKHWAGVYSMVAAGAGVGRGALFGASDRIGAYPASDPVGPGDIAATVFHALGIDPARHYQDLQGRPFAIAAGKPLTRLWCLC